MLCMRFLFFFKHAARARTHARRAAIPRARARARYFLLPHAPLELGTTPKKKSAFPSSHGHGSPSRAVRETARKTYICRRFILTGAMTGWGMLGEASESVQSAWAWLDRPVAAYLWRVSTGTSSSARLCVSVSHRETVFPKESRERDTCVACARVSLSLQAAYTSDALGCIHLTARARSLSLSLSLSLARLGGKRRRKKILFPPARILFKKEEKKTRLSHLCPSGLAARFPTAVTDFYPYNMLSLSRQSPYLTRLPYFGHTPPLRPRDKKRKKRLESQSFGALVSQIAERTVLNGSKRFLLHLFLNTRENRFVSFCIIEEKKTFLLSSDSVTGNDQGTTGCVCVRV